MTVASGQSSGGPGIFQLIRITLFGMPSTFSSGQGSQGTFSSLYGRQNLWKCSPMEWSQIFLYPQPAFLLKYILTSEKKKSRTSGSCAGRLEKEQLGERD